MATMDFQDEFTTSDTYTVGQVVSHGRVPGSTGNRHIRLFYCHTDAPAAATTDGYVSPLPHEGGDAYWSPLNWESYR